MQTPTNKELYDWLYAMNPLLAGQIRLVSHLNTSKTAIIMRILFRSRLARCQPGAPGKFSTGSQMMSTNAAH